MADNTAIDWADRTWNPLLGCERVSPGCDSCYAINTATIRAGNPHPKVAAAFAGLTERRDGRLDWTGRINLLPDRLTQPLSWRKPQKVFVNSQSDLFHKDVPDEFIAQVFAVMALAPRHTFQLLTKRHGRMRSLLNQHGFWTAVGVAAIDLEDVWLPQSGVSLDAHALPNVWLGVSVEDQKRADLRIPALLGTPAAVRWLSCEPLLGSIDLSKWIGATVGTAAASGSRGIQGRRGRGAIDRPAGPSLAPSEPPGRPVGGWGEAHSLLPASSREPGREVSPSQNHAQRPTVDIPCASAGLAALQWSDSGGFDGQPQERDLYGQPASQSGVGNLLRTADPCASRLTPGSGESVRRAERDVEANFGPGGGDSRAPRDRGAAGIDREGLQRPNAADLADCAGRPTLSWVVVGGESGSRSRPIGATWARLLRDECVGAGVPFFFKQWGGRTPKANGRVLDGRTWDEYPRVAEAVAR